MNDLPCCSSPNSDTLRLEQVHDQIGHCTEVVGEDQDADNDQEDTAENGNGPDVSASSIHVNEKGVQGQRGEEEGNSQAQRIDPQESDPRCHTLACAGIEENCGKDGTYAGGPTQGKGGTHEQRTQVSGWLACEMDPFLSMKELEAKESHYEESEEDDQDPSHFGEDPLIIQEELAQKSGGGPQGHEDRREPQDEEKGVEYGPFAEGVPSVSLRQIRQGQAGDKGDIGGDEGKHARGGEGEEPRRKSNQIAYTLSGSHGRFIPS